MLISARKARYGEPAHLRRLPGVVGDRHRPGEVLPRHLPEQHLAEHLQAEDRDVPGLAPRPSPGLERPVAARASRCLGCGAGTCGAAPMRPMRAPFSRHRSGITSIAERAPSRSTTSRSAAPGRARTACDQLLPGRRRACRRPRSRGRPRASPRAPPRRRRPRWPITGAQRRPVQPQPDAFERVALDFVGRESRAGRARASRCGRARRRLRGAAPRAAARACSTRQRRSCQVATGSPSIARTVSPARSPAARATVPASGAAEDRPRLRQPVHEEPRVEAIANRKLNAGPATTIAMRCQTLWRLNARCSFRRRDRRLRARRASSRSRRAEARR